MSYSAINFKAGQFLTRLTASMKTLPGYCQRWGCLLPVGSDSQYGEGPLCMVCSQGLRASIPVAPQEEDGDGK